MSTAQVITDQEVHEELERESTARLIYNPSNSWIIARHDAHPWPLCPDGEAVDLRTGLASTTDGVTAIGDRWGMEWVENENGKRVQSGQRVQIDSSIAVVKHLLKTYLFLRRLTGDPKRDEQTKGEAKKQWVAHRVQWAAEVIANRDAYLREFHAAPSNSGQLPNPPNGLEIEAMEFMADYRLGNVGRKSFVCQHDGYQTDDAKKWATHTRAFHPEDAAREKKAEEKTDAGKGLHKS
jgi:hypothetical protein